MSSYYYEKTQGSESSYDDGDDGLWEKPAWAKGGIKLKSTGKATAMKSDGNLAAPITFTPYKNNDHTNYVASPENLYNTAEGEKMKSDGNLAQPITNIRDELRKQKTKSNGSHCRVDRY